MISMRIVALALLICYYLAGSGAVGQHFKAPAGSRHQTVSFAFSRPIEAAATSLQLLSGREMMLISVVSLAGYGIHQWDARIDRRYARGNSAEPEIRWLTNYGKLGKCYDSNLSQLVLGGAALAAFGYSHISGHRAAGDVTRQMIKALVISSAATFALKVAIGRSRPYLNHGPYEFESFDFYMASEVWSFPSGHTSSVFALTTVLTKRAATRWVSIPAWFLAGSVGFQRMLDRKHWASDVVAGGLLGYLVGHWVVDKEEQDAERVLISPYSNGRNVGLELHF